MPSDEPQGIGIERWRSFTPEECATIAIGLTLMVMDTVMDFTGTGTPDRKRQAEIARTCYVMVSQINQHAGNEEGFDPTLMAMIDLVIEQAEPDGD